MIGYAWTELCCLKAVISLCLTPFLQISSVLPFYLESCHDAVAIGTTLSSKFVLHHYREPSTSLTPHTCNADKLNR